MSIARPCVSAIGHDDADARKSLPAAKLEKPSLAETNRLFCHVLTSRLCLSSYYSYTYRDYLHHLHSTIFHRRQGYRGRFGSDFRLYGYGDRSTYCCSRGWMRSYRQLIWKVIKVWSIPLGVLRMTSTSLYRYCI